MSIAKQLYPEIYQEAFTSPYDYAPIIRHFGTVAVQVDDADHQGDSRVLYEDGSYLQFGWGSCSGCDALQACDSFQEIDNLIAQLEASIKRFGSLRESLAFFESHDWAGDYSGSSEEQARFVAQAKEWLTAKVQA